MIDLSRKSIDRAQQIVEYCLNLLMSPAGTLFRDTKGVDAPEDAAMDDGEVATCKDDSISELGLLILQTEVRTRCQTRTSHTYNNIIRPVAKIRKFQEKSLQSTGR